MQGKRGVGLTFHMFVVIVNILLVALLVSGCGQEKEPVPATATETGVVVPDQQLVSATSAPEPAKSTQAPVEISQPPTSDVATQSASAKVADFMQKMEEKITLTTDQRAQVQSIVQEFLTNMQQRFAQMQTAGQAQGKKAGERPALTDEQRKQFANVRQGQGPMNAQLTDKLKGTLTSDQLQVFEQLLSDLRNQLAVDQAIEQMGGTSSVNKGN